MDAEEYLKNVSRENLWITLKHYLVRHDIDSNHVKEILDDRLGNKVIFFFSVDEYKEYKDEAELLHLCVDYMYPSIDEKSKDEIIDLLARFGYKLRGYQWNKGCIDQECKEKGDISISFFFTKKIGNPCIVLLRC